MHLAAMDLAGTKTAVTALEVVGNLAAFSSVAAR